MASFKRLKRSDVISVPYVANKNWVFNYCPYPENDQYITIYKGTNLTSSFNPDTEPVTENQYERLVYDSINHLHYNLKKPCHHVISLLELKITNLITQQTLQL